MTTFRDHIDRVCAVKGINFKEQFVYADGEKLIKCRDNIIEHDIPDYMYLNCEYLQSEMLNNPQIFDYISGLPEELDCIYTGRALDLLLPVLNSFGDSLYNYGVAQVAEVLPSIDSRYSVIARYLYLSCYSGQGFNESRRQDIIYRLCDILEGNVIEFRNSSKDIKDLFIDERLCLSQLVFSEDILPVCALILEDNCLLNIVRFLSDKNIDTCQSFKYYESLSENSAVIYRELLGLSEFLNDEQMTKFLKYWITNGSQLHELDVVVKAVKVMSIDDIKIAMYSMCTYTNLVYGNKINWIDICELPNNRANLIMYAISHRKNHFLKVVRDNIELFNRIDNSSVLFYSDFYTKYVNINELTAECLEKCGSLPVRSKFFVRFEDNRKYHFSEFEMLYGLPESYFILYAGLNDLSYNSRLVRMRELISNMLLEGIESFDEKKDCLVNKIREKPLSQWKNGELSGIAGLDSNIAIQILAIYDNIERFIVGIKNKDEACVVIRNYAKLEKYGNMKEVVDDILEIDQSWSRLINRFDIDEEFINRYRDNCRGFVLKNGAQVIMELTDSGNWGDSGREILMAELSNKLHTLKYHGEDLQREIAYPLQKIQRDSWIGNIKLDSGEFEGFECDDFHSIINMGVYPRPSGFSWQECGRSAMLLTLFNANRKILYVRKNGVIVGRAVMQLTKCTFTQEADYASAGALEFAHLDKLEQCSESEEAINGINIEDNSHYLAVFLERPNIAYVSDDEYNTVLEQLIGIASRKADEMGAILVISNTYRDKTLSEFVLGKTFLFISRTKAGVQYIDCNINVRKQNEGKYMPIKVYIRSKDLSGSKARD